MAGDGVDRERWREAVTRRRAGFALVPVVLLVSALLFIALAFTDAVLHGMRGARLGWQGERATHAADAVLLRALADWDRTTAAALLPGESDTLASRSLDGLTSQVVRTRLQARLFALESWVRVQDGGVRPARRAVGRSVRLEWPRPPVLATLTAGGGLTVGDRAEILGAEAVPAGWDAECALDRPTGPAVAIVSGATTRAPTSVVVGAGAPVQAFDDSARMRFREQFDATFAALAAEATVRTDDRVLTLDARTTAAPGCPVWFGDGARGPHVSPACARRWPIVHAAGVDGVELTGTTAGQGILLVDGDLVAREAVSLQGLIMVRGRVHLTARAGEDRPMLVGALIVRDSGSRLEDVRLQSSRCAVRRALSAAGRPTPIGPHGWGERP